MKTTSKFLEKLQANYASPNLAPAPCGCPAPLDANEIPTAMRNPYGTTFLQRLVGKYQTLPTLHPFNPAEKMPEFTPDVLQKIERAGMMSDLEKQKIIQTRDNKWNRGP